jgi:phospholipase C
MMRFKDRRELHCLLLLLLASLSTSAFGQAVSLSSTNVDFGNQVVSTTSVQKSVTLTNTGSATLTISSVVASSPFAVVSKCGSSVAAGADCQLKITFTPPSTGSYTGTVTLTDNASDSPQVIDLNGTGIAAVNLNPSALTYPARSLGTSSNPITVTLTNNQTVTLNISNISISGDYSETTTCGSSVAASGTCTFAVTFTPTVVGARSGTLTVTDDASSSPQTVSMTGTGNLAGLSSIAATPADPTINTTSTEQFTATGTFTGARTYPITTSVNWTSSNTAIATISNSSPTQGLATAVAAGSSTITATSGTITGTTTLTVQSAPLTSITLSPSPGSVSVGSTVQFVATGQYSDGSTQNITSSCTWSSAPKTVATVARGLATGVSAGTATITANLGTIKGTAQLTVTAPPTLTSISLAPTSGTVNIGQTLQFTATGNYSDGSQQTLTNSATWSSSNATDATIQTAGNANPGLATGVANGAVTITASYTGINGTAQLTIGSDSAVIQHIVFIIKENRSFDSYFGTFPGANGATTGMIHTGQVIPLQHLPDVMPRDLDHSWTAAIAAIDGGKMDGFDLSDNCNVNGDYLCYGQYYQSDIPNYWTYAQTFVLADAMFSSLTGESFPNHLYTIGATSGGAISNPVSQVKKGQWGCYADSTTLVTILNSDGSQTNQYPCFTFTTLADELNSAGISWRSYQPLPNESGFIWAAYAAINQIYNSSYWTTNTAPYTQFVTDAQNGNLPAVSWVVMGGDVSEHPVASVCAGENWTVEQINAVMQGPEWNSTAIFVTWDDYGGFYDHAPPQVLDQFGLGERVPLLIISPYAKPAYISNTEYEFSSMLKFVEDRFNLPTMTARDAGASDMFDSFNFGQTPLPPLVLNTRTCP